MYSRRRVLGAIPAVAATALAGCSGGSNAATIGESRELSGLTLTITEMQTTDSLTTVPDDYEEDGGQGTTTDGTSQATSGPPETTLHEAPEDSTYVVVWFTIENGSDSEQKLPAPGQQPVPFAEGNIYLTGLGQGTPLLSLDGDLWIEDEEEAYDSLTEAVADLDWTLPPGGRTGGYIIFAINEQADLSRVSVTVQAEGTITRWELR